MSPEELKALAAVPEPFMVNGTLDGAPVKQELHLVAMKLLPSLRAQEICAPFIGEMGKLSDDGQTASLVLRTQLMMEHATRFHELAVVMLGGDDAAARALLDTLDEDEFNRLLDRLIEVNGRFFVRRLLAVLSSQEHGKSTSTDPSPKATAERTSEAPGPTSSNS